MPRPRNERPTPGELEVLKVLWERGDSTVREVLDALPRSRKRAYTSLMSLLNVMTEKGLVKRTPAGRAFSYRAAAPRNETLGGLVQDLLGRAFEGSASSLVAHLLDQSQPTREELELIRAAIDEFQNERKR
jgi:predicted transcriptional regulator